MAEIQSESTERLDCLIEAPADPTGSGVPSFGVTAVDSTDQPTTWVAGTWTSAWSEDTGTIWALSPTMPTGDLTVAEGEWMMWVRYPFGAELPLDRAGEFTVV